MGIRTQKPQTNFFDALGMKGSSKPHHGGRDSIGRRKVRRPLDPGKPLHLVLRSEKATGERNFLRAEHRVRIEKLLRRQAARFGVRIASFANVGNHLHLLVRFAKRQGFRKFLVSITSLIARLVTRARRGHAFGKFWDALAFTRVLTSRREEYIARRYVQANIVEATHGRQAREAFLAKALPWMPRFRAN